jgi:predicted phosphodiesterase
VRFGIISDLHLEFDRGGSHYELSPKDDVFYLCAGDVHPREKLRNKFYEQFDYNIFYVDGNHDFYGSSFERNLSDDALKIRTLPNGMIIAGATLWTDLSNQYDWYIYTRCLVDYGSIYDLNKDDYNLAHKKHLNFLLKSNADIIVTHHCPSRYSIHEKYLNEKSNVGFTTDLTDVILKMEKPPKLWVHGHTHESFDYMIGSTRVVCHPRGYPNEREHYSKYDPVMVEIL